MPASPYLSGRKKYRRPQAMLWSNNSGYIKTEVDAETGEIYRIYSPIGYEVGADYPDEASKSEIDQFIILSDHNRSPINVSYERIENRQRTVNGTMRSRHIADKIKLSMSWDMLPSRAFASAPQFDSDSGATALTSNSVAFTADGGAGGNDLLDWYNENTGPFWVFLAYDKLTGLNSGELRYNNFTEYTQVIQMYISGFNYSVEKRGTSLYDMWNISVDLEEV